MYIPSCMTYELSNLLVAIIDAYNYPINTKDNIFAAGYEGTVFIIHLVSNLTEYFSVVFNGNKGFQKVKRHN